MIENGPSDVIDWRINRVPVAIQEKFSGGVKRFKKPLRRNQHILKSGKNIKMKKILQK